MKFHVPTENEYMPIYQTVTSVGEVVGTNHIADKSEEEVVYMYQCMVRLQAMDEVFYDAQRQGRISFYMTNTGEEGTHIGSAAALDPKDMVFAQYREAGVLMYRGFTLQQFADQCFSNVDDVGQGRQMPVHYGSVDLNYQTISSPLATQIPQAAGAAYAYKVAGENRCVICYFGDGVCFIFFQFQFFFIVNFVPNKF
eukprot:GSMAST32.ASY1.ANO1.1791.1 assembled CDS